MERDKSHAPTRLACFFKLILEPLMDLQTLEIPRNFMMTHGDDLSEIIYLTLPTGDVWKCKMVKSKDGEFCLEKGWPEFGKYYSLSFGYCIVFYYQGRSHFNVLILEASHCEIHYPFDPNQIKEKTTHHPSEPHYKGVQDVMGDAKVIVSNHNVRGTGHPLTAGEIKRIRNYASNNCKHPSFATKMQPSSVEYAFQMGMPLDFAEKFLDGSSIDMFNLQTGGKSWHVSAHYSKRRLVFSSNGWKTFALGNKLRVDDICIFELINKQGFKIHILRASDAMDNRENSTIKIEVD